MHVIEHTYVSLLADVARLSGFSEIRGSYEGLQWCLKEAPKLEKLILEAVESRGNLKIDAFPIWLRRLAQGALTDPLLMRYARQLLLFCYKASVPHDETTVKNSYQGFLDTNRIVGDFGNSLSRLSPLLLDSARRHCQSVLYGIQFEKVIPFHGPGAVTTSKDRWLHRYSTIEYMFPYSDWFSLQNREHQESWEDCETPAHIEAKLIAVPKDSRGPRLICVHPAEAIWIQQGLRVQLERAISLHRFQNGPWPRGRIRFDDQTVNGRIALTSSRSRRYATLDMKEASDRISEPLVQILFGSYYKRFGACRAQKFYIPQSANSRIVGYLNSYAPMGNATTFPVQSLVFWSICVASLQRLGFHQPGAVFVFGDDIIVPSEAAQAVIDDLESFGLLVNRSKSFYRGAFRESCGVDAFNGVNVTPVRWKTTLNAEHLTGLQSLSDIGMRLRIHGYEEAAVSTFHGLSRALYLRTGKRLCCTNNTNHGGIAEYTTNQISVWRDAYWHSSYQMFCSPVWRLKLSTPMSTQHDWNHVLESVCSLERTGRSSIPARTVSRQSRLNRGWIRIE